MLEIEDAKVGDIVVPGDRIQEFEIKNKLVNLGPGLKRHPRNRDHLIVTKAGKLSYRKPNVYFIESIRKLYLPQKNDSVIGIVVNKHGDILKVDIGVGCLASLSLYAFEGASKRRKPEVKIGDLVYAKLLTAYKEMEPELVCVDSYWKAGRMGILPEDGTLFQIRQHYVHTLLSVQNPLLRNLGKKVAYEIVIGMNGRVWVQSKSIKNTQYVVTEILKAQETNKN